MLISLSLPVLLAWNAFFTVLCVILGILLVALIALTLIGKKTQKKQAENEIAMKEASQVVSMLIIDKKRLKLKESGLPSIVMEQTPKYMRFAKLPIVKVRVGPKTLNMICDEKIFPVLPVKKEVKAIISGIYIMDIKSSRNNLETPSKQKVGRLARLRMKAQKTLDNNKK